MTDPTLCETDASLSDALETISNASHIFLDCEGTELGTRNGSLSTITVGVFTNADDIKAFVIDAIVLKTSLQPLFAVLDAETPIKVMWDGRMDSSELYHRCGVTIRSVLDLQLADVVSRQIQGEDEDDQFQRLRGPVKPGELQGSPHCYRQVHRLNGLDKCATEHHIDLPVAVSSVGHSLWKTRPLPQHLVNYAARDVTVIARIFKHFQAQNYLQPQLSEQSARYIQIHHPRIPQEGDGYTGNSFMPLDILSVPTGMTLICNCCRRSLSYRCFSATGQRLVKQRNCWVCRAVKIKESQENYDFDRDDYYGGYDSDD